MTDLERVLKFKEKLSSFVNNNAESIDDNYYKKERKYFIKRYPQKVPIFIKDCRNWNDFINRFEPTDYYQLDYNNFIDNEFLDFLDFLEFGENIQSEKINSENLDNSLSIILEKELFEHIKKLLKDEHYFEAIIESYKFCIAKLTQITGEEQAHKAFSENNYTKIFGKQSGETDIEKDYFEGIKFLHLAIQKFRNEKSHQTSHLIDKNLAFQYIILANLAFKLIKTTK